MARQARVPFGYKVIAIFLFLLIQLVFPIHPAFDVTGPAQGEILTRPGNLTVEHGTFVRYDDDTLYVDGHILIDGKLILDNVTLVINGNASGSNVIYINNSAELVMINSTIMAKDPANHYRFGIYGKADIRNSVILDLWGDLWTNKGGLEIFSDDVVMANTTVRDSYMVGVSVWNGTLGLLNSTIEGSGGVGLYGEGANIIVSGGSIKNNNDSGILLKDNSQISLQDVLIANNSYYGINPVTSNLTITNCNISGNRMGIVAHASSIIKSQNTSITNNQEFGVFVENSIYTSINDSITGNRQYGFKALTSSVWFSDSSISKNAWSGISSESSVLNVANSKVDDNGQMGIIHETIAQISKPTVSAYNSSISGNGFHGLLLKTYGSIGQIESCTIQKNGYAGIFSDESDILYIINNTFADTGMRMGDPAFGSAIALLSTGASIIGNTFINGRYDGVSAGASVVLVDGNTFDTFTYGILVEGSTLSHGNNSFTDMYFGQVIVRHRLQVNVTDSEGAPVEGALVSIYDYLDNLLVKGNTSSAGLANTYLVDYLVDVNGTELGSNVYKIIVENEGRRKTNHVTMNRTRLLEVNMDEVSSSSFRVPWEIIGPVLAILSLCLILAGLLFLSRRGTSGARAGKLRKVPRDKKK